MSVNYSEKDRKKVKRIYKCKLCNYTCKRKNDYLKHCSTQKHTDMEYFNKYKHNPDKLNEYHERKNKLDFVCECGRKYKYKSGLSRHKLKCNFDYSDSKQDNSIMDKNTSDKITDLVSLVKDLIHENKSIQDKLVEVTNEKPTQMIIQQNNNQHNHFSVKAYLNNECKNAMNLSDYVNQIKVTFDDLTYMKEHGIVKVFENTFVKGLREMAQNERPIHCSDKKRGNFYIKDDDTWMKDPENERIIDALKKITNQQCAALKQWKTLNKDWLDNEYKQEHANIVTRKIVDIYGDKNQKKILNLLTNLEILKEVLQNS